jgi:DNA-binding transcriptional regulator YiaG
MTFLVEMKMPSLSKIDSESVRALRRKLNLNQVEFWVRFGITQSGGSRYESGRNIPKPIQILLQLAYGSESKSAEVLAKLRSISQS